jgi:serine/threonine protein kinase
MATNSIHTDPDSFRRFLRGESPHAEWEEVAHAVQSDPATARTLAGIEVEDTLLDALRGCPVLHDDARTSELIRRLEVVCIDIQPGHPSRDKDFPFLSPPVSPGELGCFDDYRILRVLGTGGMGVVFEAEDEKLRRRVALKMLLPERLLGETARQRFLKEARAAAAVESDHVIPIHQVGEVQDIPFLAMPVLRGRSLEDRLSSNRVLPVSEIISFGRQIALGLSAAHERGLVHRDIKPGNLFLEDQPEGMARVKILDFGLARAAQPEEPSLTSEGGIVGTPAYMAPEQARGEAVDFRADLFSLGVVLYRAATGHLPFRGTDVQSQLLSLAADAPPHPLRRNPELPPALADLIMRLLEKKAEDRPQSARAVADELSKIDWQTALSASPKRKRRVEVALASIAAAALVLAAVIFIRDRHGNQTTLTVANGSSANVDSDGNATVTVPGQLGSTAQPAKPAIDKPFEVIRNGKTVGTHQGLADAISASRFGDVIEIRGDGPYPVGNLPRVEDRDLTLRAAAGSRPRLTEASGRDVSRPWLQVHHGTLRVDGLEWNGTDDGLWFQVQSGGCEFSRCRLVRWGDGTTIEYDGARLTLVDCVVATSRSAAFHAAASPFINASGSAKAVFEVTGNIFYSAHPVAVILVHRNGQTLRLVGNSFICMGGMPLRVDDALAGPGGALTISAERNLFATERVLQWLDPVRKVAKRTTSWTGKDNVYLCEVPGGSIAGEMGMSLRWDEWRAYWGDAETGGRVESGRLAERFQESAMKDFAAKKLEHMPNIIDELRSRFPGVGADPDRPIP